MATFQIGEAVKFGWKTATSKFGFFVGALVILFGINFLFGFLTGHGEAQREPGLVVFLVSITSLVVQIILAMGMIVIALKLVDGKEPEISDLWKTYKPFWRYLGASLLVALLVLAGMILLIVPGIIIAVGTGFFSYLIIDKGMGAVEAIKRSWEITKGSRWNLFGLVLLLWIMNMLGMLLFGLGLLVTVPTSIVAMAYVYRKLEGSTPMVAPASPPAPATVQKDLPNTAV